MMFSLFIVDDEPLVREGLKYSIDWEQQGFRVVGEAANGKEALEKITILMPDVVITDMRMNTMDGVELIQNIKRSAPHIQIIILTAYNEFSYAKTAIDNNIFAYISKPALNSEIISVFQRLKEKMEQEIQVQNTLKRYQDYRTDELLSALLHNQDPEAKELEAFRSVHNASPSEKDFFIAVIEIDKRRQFEKSHTMQLILNERINYHLSIDQNCIYKCNISLCEIALMIFTKSHNYQQQIRLLKNISEDFQRLTGKMLTIGISATFRNFSAIHRAYLQAQKALEQKARFGVGNIIDYVTLNSANAETPALHDTDIDRIIQSLILGHKNEAIAILLRYFDSLKDISIELAVVKASVVELSILVIKQVIKNAYTLQLVFGKSVRPAADIQALSTIEEIKAYIMDFIEKVYENIQSLRDLALTAAYYSPTTNQAIAYIVSNYAKNIKMSDVIKTLHISESRLMHLFKSETGKTFNHFLTEYRIRLAETMLQSGQYKLYEISEMVGYQNLITFRRAFLKVTGTIPSQYPKKTGDNNEAEL